MCGLVKQNGIDVTSEVLPLKTVLLHRPGEELEHLEPDSLARLLFDDIPFLRQAQIEHDNFANLLRSEGVEVVYVEDLLAQVLKSSPETKESFVDTFLLQANLRSQEVFDLVKDYLMTLKSEEAIVKCVISGLSREEIPSLNATRLEDLVGRYVKHFLLDPLPNLYFTRDAFSSIGSGASLNHMFSPIRKKESTIAAFILKKHPAFLSTKLYYTPEMQASIEGGDILVLNDSVLAVGLSQRTGPGAVEVLAQNIFLDPESTFTSILAVKIPSKRAFMHLDTVFTQVDLDKFVIHPGILEYLQVFSLNKRIDADWTQFQAERSKDFIHIQEEQGSFQDILARYMEVDQITFIPCGGNDRIAAEREQWNDGSNTLCVSPGRVIVYDRNIYTNHLLESYGITCLAMPSSELSRGRGGPRCMSMPLLRMNWEDFQQI